MSKNPQKKCQYRKEGCGLSYTLPHNCLKHEKLIGDMPLKWRDRNESLHDAELKMFKCSFPNCSVSSKQKSNLKRKTYDNMSSNQETKALQTDMLKLQIKIFSKIQS